MAKWRITERAFIGSRLVEPGEEVETGNNIIPGPHMVPLDAQAKDLALLHEDSMEDRGDLIDRLTESPSDAAQGEQNGAA